MRHELNARNYFPHKPRIKRSCDITQRKQFRLRHLQINMANEDVSSLIVLDSTGAPCSFSDSSVISLDTSSIVDQTDHVDQCAEQKESLRSVIIISDLSSAEEDNIQVLHTSTDEQTEGKSGESFTTPATTVSVQDGSVSDSGAENKEPMPAREAQVPSTPVDRICKRRQINEGLADDCASTCNQPLASTPLAGSAIALKQPTEPTVTPITVRYERIRADLSATKKEQKKLLTLQEVQGVKFQELQQEMQRFREETTKKRKREEEEEKKSLSILLDVKSDQDDSLLRPVVIDGSNVAMSHGCGKVFSCKGIALCIQFFLRRGHTSISALVPRHCKNGQAPRSCPIKDAHILDELESKGFLSFTPSRNLNGKRCTPYDDRMIVQLACRNGGVVVSNDNYRDLMKESAEFKAVIESRLIMYTFVGDTFMVPEDPHGRYGPLLSEVLKRPEKAPLPSMVHSALHNHRRTPLEQLRHQWQNRF